MKVNTGIMPPVENHPGQWAFYEGTVCILGNSFEQLVARLGVWRVQNGRPIGNPQADINKQICDRYPHFCHMEAGDVPPEQLAKRQPEAKELGYVSEYLARLRHGPYVIASDSQADVRARKCINCPHNVAWDAVGCGVCIQSAKAELLKVRNGKNGDDGLRMCNLAKVELKTAVYLDIKYAPVLHPQTLPDYCWIKNNE